MPLVNQLGEFIMGSGGLQGSIMGKVYPFASVGRGAFFDNNTIIVQQSKDNILYKWNFRDGFDPVAITPPRGATYITGNGGKYLCNLGPVMYGNSISDTSNAAVIGCAYDGTQAYFPNAGTGVGLTIINPNGVIQSYPSIVAKPAPHVVKAGTVIWEGGAVGREPLKPALKDAQNPQLIYLDNQEWILYWSGSTGLILQPNGEQSGWILDNRGLEFDACGVQVGSDMHIGWSVTSQEGPNDLAILAINQKSSEFIKLAANWTPQVPIWRNLVQDPIPPDKPIGPDSQPLTDDGTFYDLRNYFVSSNFKPRSGPTHPINQVNGPEDIYYFVKFNNPQAYEMWGIDSNWANLLTDASGEVDNGISAVNYFTDSRFFPLSMRIGETNAFVTGPHEVVHINRNTCEQLFTEPINRKMWIYAIYPSYYWGKDFGSLKTLVTVYDNTAGIHNSGRMIELGYYGWDEGGLQWEAYRSDLVYRNGPNSAPIFDDISRTARSSFYLINGPNTQVDPSPCIKPICPHFPAWKKPDFGKRSKYHG